MLLSLSTLLLLPTLLLAAPKPLTIYTSPVPSTSKPTAFLTLSYDSSTLSAEVQSYTPPKDTSASLSRVGFYSADSSWHGVVTSSLSFAPEYQKRISLHVDDAGNVYHIGFSTSGRGVQAPSPKAVGIPKDSSKAEDEVVVEVVPRTMGPQVHFNKPVVLNAEGKIEAKEPEKSFLQKYWWAIALFLLVQLVAGGGGGEEKK